jgi:hypothetical protein
MTRFYGIDEANERLTDLRPLLEGLRADRDAVAAEQAELIKFRAGNGSSKHALELEEREERVREIVRRMQQAVARIEEWDVTLRDIETGLIDFPALVSGRPVWLCWRLGEDDVGWWHELTTGVAGRRPLAELA